MSGIVELEGLGVCRLEGVELVGDVDMTLLVWLDSEVDTDFDEDEACDEELGAVVAGNADAVAVRAARSLFGGSF